MSAALHWAAMLSYGTALVALLVPLRRPSFLRSAAVIPSFLGLGIQLLQLVLRWRASGHLPVTGLFETQHFLSLWVMAATCYFYFRYHARAFMPAALALSLAALAFASRGPRDIVSLTPAIDTPLFLIHVATSFAAYGLFGVAALQGLYQLAGQEAAPEGNSGRLLDESLYLGYILFTWCMIAGSLWAYLAWGSYWTWKIKGLWSWILWFYYSGLLHLRHRRRWQGWPVSLLAIAGFLLTLFSYLGLGLLFRTSHPLL